MTSSVPPPLARSIRSSDVLRNSGSDEKRIFPLYQATQPFRTKTVPRDATSSPPSGRILKSGRASGAPMAMGRERSGASGNGGCSSGASATGGKLLDRDAARGHRHLADLGLRRGRRVGVGRAAGGLAAVAAQRLLDLDDPPLRARDPEMFEGQPQLSARLVEQAEVEMAPEMPGRELDGLAKLELGLREKAGLEEDQAEIRAEDLRGRVVGEERAGRVGRLVVVPALEFEKRQEVEHVLVARPERPGLLELLPGLVEPAIAHALARAIEVEKEQTLIDGGQIVGGGLHGIAPAGR